MTEQAAWPEDLEPRVAEVFRGPLEGFIARRDALVKELRAADRREDADAVKRLRKPTRTVWALDSAVLADSDPVERVAAAVMGMLAAQEGRGPVRDASTELRDAVRDLAAAGARAAAAAGHRVDQADLAPAVLAVVGDANAFEALRAGRLVELPSAGGLDVLTGMPQLAPVSSPATTLQPTPAPVADPSALADAREAVDRAEATAATARERATEAERVLRDGEADAEAAEERLAEAEEAARRSRTRLLQAREEVRTAQQQLRQAERLAARARAALDALTD